MLALAEAADGPQDGRGVARGLEAHVGARARRRSQSPLAVCQPERRAHRAPPAGAQSEYNLSQILAYWRPLYVLTTTQLFEHLIVDVFAGKNK